MSTSDTNGMQLGDVISLSQQVRDLPERLAEKVHVQTCDDHPDSLSGELIAHFGKLVIKELGLVDPDNIDIAGKQQDCLGVINRSGWG